MLEYVTGTTSLSAAENDAYAKTLANSIGTEREEGKLTGNAASIYMPSQLTASDANLVERLTGTSNIIDAAHSSNQSVANLVEKIATDRQSGALKGDLSVGYFRTIARYDLNRLLFHHFKGVSVSFKLPSTRSPISSRVRTRPTRRLRRTLNREIRPCDTSSGM